MPSLCETELKESVRFNMTTTGIWLSQVHQGIIQFVKYFIEMKSGMYILQWYTESLSLMAYYKLASIFFMRAFLTGNPPIYIRTKESDSPL